MSQLDCKAALAIVVAIVVGCCYRCACLFEEPEAGRCWVLLHTGAGTHSLLAAVHQLLLATGIALLADSAWLLVVCRCLLGPSLHCSSPAPPGSL
jgi:hypothetical protein